MTTMNMEAMQFTLYSNESNCKCLLIYLYETNCSVVETADVVNAKGLMQSMYVDWERDFDVQLLGLSRGSHSLRWENHSIEVVVSRYLDDRKLFTTNEYRPEIVQEVLIRGATLTADVMQQMCKSAVAYIEKKFKDITHCQKKHIKKYIYVAEEGYWDLMNNTQSRSMETLFLKAGEKEALYHFVKDFLAEDTQKDYEKFSIPYKANVLLYGKPGTGKTSTILSIASELKMNIGLIPISKSLDDTKLIHAMNSIKKNDCKVIVFEDVDCLFVDRKQHDSYKNALTMSGLLNCLDGLFRNDGIIVFMTANNISAMDEALLRSARIDYTLKYDYADEYQAKECFRFYFPHKDEDEFEELFTAIKYKQYTISMLQQFFFKHRKKERLTKHVHELIEIVQGTSKEEQMEDGKPSHHLYM